MFDFFNYYFKDELVVEWWVEGVDYFDFKDYICDYC